MNKGRMLAAGLVAAGVAGAGVYGYESAQQPTSPEVSALGDVTTTTVGEPTEQCATTWEMTGLPTNDKHRVLVDGIPQLETATNETEARDALGLWTAIISTDPEVLADYGSALTEQDVDPATLVDADGCATDAADELRTDIELQVALGDVSDGSVDITEGTNTGVGANGRVVIASTPGVSGNTKGVEVVTKDGKRWGALRRCGNLVIKLGITPSLPEGPTDEAEPTPGVTPKQDKHTTPRPTVVPRDGDHSAGDEWGAGQGPSSVNNGPDGYGDGQNRPVTPPAAPEVTSSPPTTEGRPTATTTPRPTSTNPPVTFNPGTTPPTTAPQGGHVGEDI